MPPATPMRVEWDRIDSKVYEEMVACLLSTLHPNARRIDGSGGDGGRDVSFLGPAGLEIFELKSFTGRVNNSRRRQVKRSFTRAMTHTPATWTLVVPIDLNPAEERWFNGLTAGSSAKCSWMGLTDLNREMANFPRIFRWFLEDVNAEIRRVAELFQAEKAALSNGVADAMQRIRDIADLCDELDPFYKVDIRYDSATGASECFLSPRYPGAEQDRPIRLKADLVFSDDEKSNDVLSSLQATFDFGTATTVPAEYVKKLTVDAPAGLGGDFTSGELTVGPASIPGLPTFKLNLRVTDPNGSHITTLGLNCRSQSSGAKGLIIELDDPSGSFKGTLKLDWSAFTSEANYKISHVGAQPSAILPVLRYLAAAHRPNLLTWTLQDGTPLGPPTPLQQDGDPGHEQWLRVVESLARVQNAAGVWFDIPDGLTHDDVEGLMVADKLLAGETVPGTWSGQVSMTMTVANARANIDEIARLTGDVGNASTVFLVRDLTLTLGGHEVPLGVVTSVFHSARLVDPAATVSALNEAADDEEEVVLRFEPASSDTMEDRPGAPPGATFARDKG